MFLGLPMLLLLKKKHHVNTLFELLKSIMQKYLGFLVPLVGRIFVSKLKASVLLKFVPISSCVKKEISNVHRCETFKFKTSLTSFPLLPSKFMASSLFNHTGHSNNK